MWVLTVTSAHCSRVNGQQQQQPAGKRTHRQECCLACLSFPQRSGWLVDSLVVSHTGWLFHKLAWLVCLLAWVKVVWVADRLAFPLLTSWLLSVLEEMVPVLLSETPEMET